MFGGVGIWHPDSKTLGKVRDAIVAKPKQWQKIVNDKQFTADYRLEGESLARPPKGYDPDHPLIDDLKRKELRCDKTAGGVGRSCGRLRRPVREPVPGRRPLRPVLDRGRGVAMVAPASVL